MSATALMVEGSPLEHSAQRATSGGQHVAADSLDPRRVLSVAGFSVPNSRGYACQDRWFTGTSPDGAWVVVADGISGGVNGAEAAQAAATVANAILAGSPLDEAAVYRAIDTANASLAGWYRDDEVGGSTVTVAVISGDRILVGYVGDSPAWVVRVTPDQGLRVDRVTEVSPGRALTAWVGSGEPPFPVLCEHDADGVAFVVVCTDGVDPKTVVDAVGGSYGSGNSIGTADTSADAVADGAPSSFPSLSAQELVALLLDAPAVADDDATAAVIATCLRHPTEQTYPSTEPLPPAVETRNA